MTDARSRSALSAPAIVIPCQRPIPEDSKARAAFSEYYQRDFLGLTRFVMRLGAKPHASAS
ncbi:hypothetical protein [Streptomyces rubiginosohelvolus]